MSTRSALQETRDRGDIDDLGSVSFDALGTFLEQRQEGGSGELYAQLVMLVLWGYPDTYVVRSDVCGKDGIPLAELALQQLLRVLVGVLRLLVALARAFSSDTSVVGPTSSASVLMNHGVRCRDSQDVDALGRGFVDLFHDFADTFLGGDVTSDRHDVAVRSVFLRNVLQLFGVSRSDEDLLCTVLG